MIRCIVATDRMRGIAKNGYQPWSLPADEIYFTNQTKLYGGNILVGGTTFRNSLKNQPLEGRQNYLLTHHDTPVEGVTLVHNLEAFLAGWQDRDLWVIGGENVYKQVLVAGKVDEIYVTVIEADFGCDQFFPEIPSEFKVKTKSKLHQENGLHFAYYVYAR
jgi:dihydrofolate reductase